MPAHDYDASSHVCYGCEAVALARKQFADAPEAMYGRQFTVTRVDDEEE